MRRLLARPFPQPAGHAPVAGVLIAALMAIAAAVNALAVLSPVTAGAVLFGAAP